MAFKVRLNNTYPNYARSFYDAVTGVNLTIKEPESVDLSSQSNLVNIAKGIDGGTLVVSEGVCPVSFHSGRYDMHHVFMDSVAVSAGAESESEEITVGGSTDKTWFIVTDQSFDITISLSPDGINWFDYRTETVDNTNAIVSHSTVARMAKVTALNNSGSEGEVAVVLYARYV